MRATVTHLRSKLPGTKTTIFTTVGNLARKHKAIDLSQGFPNFGADPKLIAMVTNAMKAGHNQYAPMQGYFGLREAIVEKIERLHGRSYHPETEVTVTVGATQALYTAISAFVHPGDEVIVFKPAYDCYEPAIEANGGVPVLIQLNNDGFKVDWEEFRSRLNSKTRMVIINSPHNPSGTVLSRADMLQLQELLRPTNCILVSDEVYEHIVFDGLAHESASRFADLAARSFVCASFGKTFHVTGWKIGYCVAPADLMREFLKIHQFSVFSIDHPTQRGLADYLREASHYLDLGNFYQQKRDFFLSGLSHPGFSYTPSKGTYFQLLRYADISTEPDEQLAQRLITHHGLACIPISSFNVNGADSKLLRFCFAKTEETLEKALKILNSFNP